MDAARADRERMKTLLVEAISTLCRNGLQYDEELTVEGLIGITLDKRDVFLISVKETFALPPHLSKKKEQVTESSPSSEKKSRRASKRSASAHDDGPAEKHRHKGASRISCDNEQQLQDSENEDNVDTFDQNSRNSIDNSEHSLGAGREKDDCIVIDPDLSIKTEGIKAERLSQNTCMYSDSAQEPASSQTSGDEDSRSRHPAGVDPDQLGVLFPIELKAEQDSDPDISVFSTHGGEVIRMPSSMKRQSSDQPVPVNIVMQGASTSSAQGFQNMQDFSSPGNWNSPGSQQQIAHQAPSSSGASQQRGYAKIYVEETEDNGCKRYVCTVCSKQYRQASNAFTHVREKHLTVHYTCPLCPYHHGRRNMAANHIRSRHRVEMEPQLREISVENSPSGRTTKAAQNELLLVQ